jgi:hypothetical protein
MPYQGTGPNPSMPRALLEKIAPWLLNRGIAVSRPVASAGTTLATLETLVGDTLHMQVGEYARVAMLGKDDGEAARDIEGQSFGPRPRVTLVDPSEATNGVFVISDDVPPDPNVVRVTAVGTGTADLIVGADADLDVPVLPLSRTVHVNVYAPASAIYIYFKVSGVSSEQLYFGTGGISVPIDRTAIIRLEGRDAQGNTVPLTNQVLCAGFACSGTDRFHLVDNGNGTWTLFPDLTTEPFADLTAKAEGDPYRGGVPLLLTSEIEIVQPWATHLVLSAGIQPV